ncbi:MFS transporter [Vibrio sp. WXL103]|uniref:MFS transporter n=1 Tax=Vibrio sp. WXL103 TaxID=3450710 RepID=UPI003EC6634D
MPNLHSKPSLFKITIALCLAQFCLANDIATLSISTSALVYHFQSNVDDLKIIGTIYPLIGASLMLTSGVLGLYVGWRRMLIIGLIIGTLGSLAKIVSPSIESMTYLARPLIGLAGVAILPSCIALVIGHFPAKKHAQLFGLIAASTGLAAATIPIVNGFLIDYIGWQIGFAITGFCYLVAALIATCWIPPLTNQVPKKFDAIGALISLFGMMFIITGLLKAPEWGVWLNRSTLYLPGPLSDVSLSLLAIIAGILLMIAFVKHEQSFDKRYQSALIPANWFSNKRLCLGLLLLLTMYVIFGGLNFTLVAYLQVGLNLSASQTGLIVLTFATTLIAASILTPQLLGRFKNESIAAVGFTVCILGAFLTIYGTEAHTFDWRIYIAMIAFGSGLGMLSSQTVAIITQSVTLAQAERTGGIQATIRNVGLAMGIAVIAGSGQYAMEHDIRHAVAQPAISHSPVLDKIDQASSLPYITDHMLRLYLDELMIEVQTQQTLISINANARLTNFRTSMYIIILFGLIGTIVSMRLGAQKSP